MRIRPRPRSSSRNAPRLRTRSPLPQRTPRLTYAELQRGALQIAAYLENMGVRPGDLVGIATERGSAMVEALLGIWLAGAAYVPLDPAYPEARLAMILAETCVPVLVTDSRSVEKFRNVPTQLVLLDRDRAAIEAMVPSLHTVLQSASSNASAERLAYVLFTSGSTGKPKGVEVTHANLANFLLSMQQRPAIAAGDLLLAVTTLSSTSRRSSFTCRSSQAQPFTSLRARPPQTRGCSHAYSTASPSP